MLNNILPEKISSALDKIPYSSLCELRLRTGGPILTNILGENYYLAEDRIVKDSNMALKIGDGVINSIIQRLSNYSLYSINDQLIDGYITYDGGIRVGICGEIVYVDNNIRTIKNISSITFRFPHNIRNCSLDIIPYIHNNGNVNSTLIISPPGAGKTTFLRDIIYQLSKDKNIFNILVVDEREELTSIFNGNDVESLSNIDVYKKCSKGFAFNNGIRSMKPDIIVTDEINIERDIEDIENALTSGVCVIASIHAKNIEDIRLKSKFGSVLEKRLFRRYIVLSREFGLGNIAGVYNENLKLIGV